MENKTELQTEQSEKANGRRILIALRQIIHATDKYSRKLRTEHQITTPQLICLSCISENSPISASGVSKEIHVSKSTLVGIIDRLEEKGFISRIRDSKDRRQVFLEITGKGRAMIEAAPSPLQDKLTAKLTGLSDKEQNRIAASLEQLVDMMDAGDIDKNAILEVSMITTL